MLEQRMGTEAAATTCSVQHKSEMKYIAEDEDLPFMNRDHNHDNARRAPVY
jgi:hypothetical protein